MGSPARSATPASTSARRADRDVALMLLSYVVVVGVADRLSPVLVLGCIAALYALILLAPPLASTDVFSYQFYGRMGSCTAPTPTS